MYGTVRSWPSTAAYCMLALPKRVVQRSSARPQICPDLSESSTLPAMCSEYRNRNLTPRPRSAAPMPSTPACVTQAVYINPGAHRVELLRPCGRTDPREHTQVSTARSFSRLAALWRQDAPPRGTSRCLHTSYCHGVPDLIRPRLEIAISSYPSISGPRAGAARRGA